MTDRYQRLFDGAPIALWDEDFSQVAAQLSLWRESGLVDLAGYLEERPDKVVELASEIRVVDVNRAGMQLLGAPSKEVALTGFRDDAIFTDDVRKVFEQQFLAIWNGDARVTVEQRGSAIDGRVFESLVDWQAEVTSLGPDYSSVIVAIWDVTAMKEARRELERAQAAQDALLGSVGDRIRAPLSAVMEQLSMLSGAPLDGSQADVERELVDSIAEAATDLSYLVENLLVEAGADELTFVTVDLSAEVRAVAEEMGPSQRPAVFAGGHVLTAGDPAKVRQIVRNLVVNAYRHGREPVEVAVSTSHGQVHVEVSDAGTGPPRSETTMWRDDDREDRTVRARRVGMGLRVSRHLALRMGGDVLYFRRDNRSVFRLSLPALADASADSVG